MKGHLFALALIAAFASTASADELAEKLAAGETIYKKDCAGCHGEQGISSPTGSAPHLAGQKAKYIKFELLAFQKGERPGRLMGSWLSAYTEKDFENLGLYISNLKQPCQ